MSEELGIPEQTNPIADAIAHPVTKGLGEKSLGDVFAKVVKTATGANAYEKDKAESDFKMLAKQNVANDSAMEAIPPGVDQQKVRGDYVLSVVGDRKMYINGNELLIVSKTQTHTVDEIARLFYNNTRKVVIADDDTLTVHGAQQVFIVGESGHQFIGKHEVTAPEEFEWKTLERGFSAYKLDTAVTDIDIHGVGVDVHGVDFEAALIEGKTGVLSEALKGQEGKADALQLEVSIQVDVKGRADVLVDIGLGTPFR